MEKCRGGGEGVRVCDLCPGLFQLAVLFSAILAVVSPANRCKDIAGETSPLGGAQRDGVV